MLKFGILFCYFMVYGVQARNDWSPSRRNTNNPSDTTPEPAPEPEVNELSILTSKRAIIDFDELKNNNISSARGKSVTGTKYSTQLNSKTWRFARVEPSQFQTYHTVNNRALNTASTVTSETETGSSNSSTGENMYTTRRGNRIHHLSSSNKPDLRRTITQETSTYNWPDREDYMVKRKTATTPDFTTVPTRSAHTSTSSRRSLDTSTILAPKTTDRWYHPVIWDNWTFWSPCSRTCGQGIMIRTRQCLVWDGEKFSRTHITGCNGTDISYKVCHRRKCSRLEEDYHSEQCDFLNKRPFLTTKYSKWLPSYPPDRPCYLHCRPETGSRTYNFGKVQDGTKCFRTGSSVCISGKCKTVGCDGVVESTVSPDMCGICNGKNSTCYRVYKTVLSEFPLPDSEFPDYTRIVTIPRGSRNLKIMDYSRNNLALMDRENTFIINGDRLVQEGGKYKIAGMTVTYIRSGTLGEIIRADGPVTEDITVMLLYRQKNHEIKYEYWKPKIISKNRNVPDDTRHPKRTKITTDLSEDKIWRKIMSEVSKKKNEFLQSKWRYDQKLSNNNEVLYPSDNRKTTQKSKRRPTLRKKKLKFNKKNCPKCWKVKDRKKQFCQSDFVSRILVKSAEILNGETRYEVTVIKNYKDGGAILLNREFLWVPNICKCPRLNVGKEFIVMGKMASVRQSEMRLTLTEKNYVRKFRPQREPKLHRLRRKLACK